MELRRNESLASNAQLSYSGRMTYERLADFVQSRMRMSHVYQPVMLIAVLRGGGRRSTTQIAKSILAHDDSQVEYYEKVTNNMVGRVLRNHGIVEKDGSGYSLVGYDDLDGEQVERLVQLCQTKLGEYKERRGRRIWQHRRVSSGYVPGTLRYEVLKRARFRCELRRTRSPEITTSWPHFRPYRTCR
jgi:ATP adenylyltransferase